MHADVTIVPPIWRQKKKLDKRTFAFGYTMVSRVRLAAILARRERPLSLAIAKMPSRSSPISCGHLIDHAGASALSWP